jgi:hypothetical protein
MMAGIEMSSSANLDADVQWMARQFIDGEGLAKICE